jgi:hypothetical protein
MAKECGPNMHDIVVGKMSEMLVHFGVVACCSNKQ